MADRRMAAMLLPFAVAASGCVASVYACEDDGQCPNGFCEASGYCSFSDAECTSGRRYGSFAGDGLSGTCVPALDSSTGADLTTGPVENTTTGSGESTTADASSSGAATSGVVPMTSSGGESSTSSASSTGVGDASTSTGEPVSRVEDGLIVFYRFDEGGGTTVHDTAPQDPPIDLTLEGKGYEWTSDGLRFLGDAATIAGSTTSVTKVNDACIESNALTMEAWVTPEALATAGPPRMITYSRNSGSRNASWMLGEPIDGGAAAFRGRVRVDAKLVNGTPTTRFELPDDANGQLAHAVYVHEADGVDRIYLDGDLVETAARAGDFSVWDTTASSRIGLGNEFGKEARPLTGTLHLTAVYCRALQASEVLQNFQAGF